MRKNHRPERLGEEIRKIISRQLLRGELKDPAFENMIGISDVHVSGDGSYATVYFTALSYDSQKDCGQEVLDAFQRCRGYIRGAIGRQLSIRYAPELTFKIDASFAYGAKMDRLLDSLNIPPAEGGANPPGEDFDEFAEEYD